MASRMYESISINKYRGFLNLRLHDLGRLNLLVGTNNCGKTSVLEAIDLFASPNFFRSIWRISGQRGERRYFPKKSSEDLEVYADVSHLFFGHDFKYGSTFSLTGKKSGESVPEIHDFKLHADGEDLNGKSNGLKISHSLLDYDRTFFSRLSTIDSTQLYNSFRLSARGGNPLEVTSRGKLDSPVNYISTQSLNADETLSKLGEVVLTPEEEILLEALRAIDPAIEDIRSVADEHNLYHGKSNILVKRKGSSERLPIGTMGDGMWRMLGLAIALVTAQNGILLVDEIDTGLHYSVMTDMWKLIQHTSKRLNVQVFATTHSRDCYESLASIARETDSAENEVSIQRIERDRAESIAYSEQEIIIAAERGLEVR